MLNHIKRHFYEENVCNYLLSNIIFHDFIAIGRIILGFIS